MNFKLDKGTGYMYCYEPNHCTANAAGKVLEHVFVMYKAIGRKLSPGECVHHIDRDRTNNDLSNLRLMTITEHALLHAVGDRGFKLEIRNCPTCHDSFQCSSKSNQKYCQFSCATFDKQKFSLFREDLYFLVWTMPTTKVAKILGVSDVAVAKRCKKLNVPKPPRGYWAKLQSGVIPEVQPLD